MGVLLNEKWGDKPLEVSGRLRYPAWSREILALAESRGSLNNYHISYVLQFNLTQLRREDAV